VYCSLQMVRLIPSRDNASLNKILKELFIKEKQLRLLCMEQP